MKSFLPVPLMRGRCKSVRARVSRCCFWRSLTVPTTGVQHTQGRDPLEVCAGHAHTRSPVCIWSEGADLGGEAVTIHQSCVLQRNLVRNKTDHFISPPQITRMMPLKAFKCLLSSKSLSKDTPAKVFFSCNMTYKNNRSALGPLMQRRASTG